MENLSEQSLIHNLDEKTSEAGLPYAHFLSYLGLAILFGVIIGFALTKLPFKPTKIIGEKSQPAKTVGVADKKTFRDKAEGILKEGGIDGEGNFHLQRPGGESQNVYLTSTTVDLSQYVGKKVRVWGETFTAEKAGWLMDVGLVELLQ